MKHSLLSHKAVLGYARVSLLALAFAVGYSVAAHAGDRWNDSGFSLDHHFYSDERFQGGYYAPGPAPAPTYERAPGPLDGINITEGPIFTGDPATVRHPDAYIDATPAEIAKATHDRRVCAPIKLYLETGVVYQRADGCRK